MVASLDEIVEFLQNPGKIIIFGASSNPMKAGYYVPEYLARKGFEIIPVNPNIDSFLGKKVYDKLTDVDLEDVKGIIIYRVTQQAERVALKAIELNIPFIWLPDNVKSKKAEKLAEAKGIKFVHDRCPLRDSKRLL